MNIEEIQNVIDELSGYEKDLLNCPCADILERHNLDERAGYVHTIVKRLESAINNKEN